MRGTEHSHQQPKWAGGITPACAGNSAACRAGGMAAEDHPRVCGEQRGAHGISMGCSGSPPRVRGTGRTFSAPSFHPRITPACAGNRGQTGSFVVRWGDHPRVCGEQGPGGPFCGTMKGSPPRVRGTAYECEHVIATLRITPACAGNSYKSYKP